MNARPNLHVHALLLGAGKSNVLDALAFCAGCPASALRVKVLRELVHQDAQQVRWPPLQHACS
jgi:chromosome segregation ATPase